MVTLLAEFEIAADTELLRSPRRKLRLLTDARNSGGALRATIQDLSRTGMLVASPVALSEGDAIDIELPQVGAVTARIIWTHGGLAGCEFVKVLPQSAVSASLLLSPNLKSQNEETAIPPAIVPRRDLTGLAVGTLVALLLAVSMLLLGLLLG